MPALAQTQTDPADAVLEGEYLRTQRVVSAKSNDPDFYSGPLPGPPTVTRNTFTAAGMVKVKGVPSVPFSGSGGSFTYTREFSGDAGCLDRETGEERLPRGDIEVEHTLTPTEAEDGIITRLSVRVVAVYTYTPGQVSQNCPPRLTEVSRGELVRIPGTAAVATSQDQTLTVAVSVDADPRSVAAGDTISVPVTVTAQATATGGKQACSKIKPPLTEPVNLDAVVLASSGGSRLVGTKGKPLNPDGTRVETNLPLAVESDGREGCVHRTVVQATASVVVPEDTAPGKYPLIPLLSGLPKKVASADSGKLAITVTAPAASPTPSPEPGDPPGAAAPAAAPPPGGALLAPGTPLSLTSDAGGRSALLAVLAAAAVALFPGMRGPRARVVALLAGAVAIVGGTVEVVAGGLLGDIDVSQHLGSGGLSMATGLTAVVSALSRPGASGMLARVGLFIPWVSRGTDDERKAGPVVPILLGLWVFASQLLHGVTMTRAAISGGIALLAAALAVGLAGGTRGAARRTGMVAAAVLTVVSYLGVVLNDDTGARPVSEIVIALVLLAAGVVVAASASRRKAPAEPAEDVDENPQLGSA